MKGPVEPPGEKAGASVKPVCRREGNTPFIYKRYKRVQLNRSGEKL